MMIRTRTNRYLSVTSGPSAVKPLGVLAPVAVKVA
jgi:hypothetical protein